MSTFVLVGLLAGLGWAFLGGDEHSRLSRPGDAPSAATRDEAKDGAGGNRTGALPLRGTTVVLDPGHNPGNKDHPEEINRHVAIGDGTKECDTTGTATEDGYAEAAFTLALTKQVSRVLTARGAEVVWTHGSPHGRHGDLPYGPCIDERAARGNHAGADAALSLHADGAPADARGFHVIMPGRVHAEEADTRSIVAPSARLGRAVAKGYRSATHARPATYIGAGDGLDTRTDLGGLNLSRVPKVFLECGNMRNAADAAHFTSSAWRERAGTGIANGLTRYLTARHAPGQRR